MPVLSANPPVDGEDLEYPYLSTTVSISSRVEAAQVKTSVALKATAYRTDGDGVNAELVGARRSFVFGDLTAAGAKDPAVAQLQADLDAAFQRFYQAKGV